MFDIGAIELFMVAILAIIVIGPRELPKALRSLGKIWGQVRDLKEQVTDQIDELISEDEMQEIRQMREQALAVKNKTNQALKGGKINLADQIKSPSKTES